MGDFLKLSLEQGQGAHAWRRRGRRTAPMQSQRQWRPAPNNDSDAHAQRLWNPTRVDMQVPARTRSPQRHGATCCGVTLPTQIPMVKHSTPAPGRQRCGRRARRTAAPALAAPPRPAATMSPPPPRHPPPARRPYSHGSQDPQRNILFECFSCCCTASLTPFRMLQLAEQEPSAGEGDVARVRRYVRQPAK